MYLDYTSALEMSGLEKLSERRQKKICLDFSLKAIKHPRNSRIFPLAELNPAYNVRNSEKFKVNFGRTTAYMESAVPYCQRLLNQKQTRSVNAMTC